MSRKRGNGEGAISRRRNGGWMAQYYVHTAAGRKRKTLYGRTRDDVATKLTKDLSDRADGIVFDDQGLTLGEYLDLCGAPPAPPRRPFENHARMTAHLLRLFARNPKALILLDGQDHLPPLTFLIHYVPGAHTRLLFTNTRDRIPA